MSSGVNFHPVSIDTAKNVMPAIKYILGLDISAADKRARIKTVLDLIGSDYYAQMFGASSEVFDSAAIDTMGYTEMDDQVSRLATKLVRQNALGRPVDAMVKSFYDSLLGSAQEEAFRNAISLDKHPTLTRTMVGETCAWCQALAGTHVYPDGDLFRRHANCDCLLVTSGYNSRNGVVNNYVKGPGGSKDTAAAQKSYIADIFGENKAGVGAPIVVEKSRANRDDDIELAGYLKRHFGGDYTVLGDINPDGVKSPDVLLRNRSVFENKSVSGATSADSQLRKAIKQLQESSKRSDKVGGAELRRVAVLNISDESRLSNNDLVDIIYNRAGRSLNSSLAPVDYVMVRKRGAGPWFMPL